jgi:hypothetical protein
MLGSTPLVLRAKVHVASQHGCSQSEASQAVISEISLTVSGGQVKLAIEAFESSSFGPSAGRYMQGDRNFHRDSTRWRWTYTGVAERAGGKLLLQFNRLETVVDRRGGIDYQEPRHEAAATTVTCTEGTVGLLAPFSNRGEGASPEVASCGAVVLCAGLLELVHIPFESLTPLAPRTLIDGALPLLPGKGIDVDVRHFHSLDLTSFRRSDS